MAQKKKSHDNGKASVVRLQPEQQRGQTANEHKRSVPPINALARVATVPAATLRPADVLALQRAFGNRAVRRLLGQQPRALPGQSASAANAIQRKTEEEEPLQGKFKLGERKENRTGLPDGLKAGIENLSGIAMDDVKVHYNSTKPAEVEASAYTQGTDIYLAPDKEKSLPHEAWHVAQQKQGRVKPTLQGKGLPINDDAGLEREADVMGSRAAASQFQVLPDMQRAALRVVAPFGVSSIQRVLEEKEKKALAKLKGTIDQDKKDLEELEKKEETEKQKGKNLDKSLVNKKNKAKERVARYEALMKKDAEPSPEEKKKLEDKKKLLAEQEEKEAVLRKKEQAIKEEQEKKQQAEATDKRRKELANQLNEIKAAANKVTATASQVKKDIISKVKNYEYLKDCKTVKEQLDKINKAVKGAKEAQAKADSITSATTDKEANDLLAAANNAEIEITAAPNQLKIVIAAEEKALNVTKQNDYRAAAKSIRLGYVQGAKFYLNNTYVSGVERNSGFGGEYKLIGGNVNWTLHVHRDKNAKLVKAHTKKEGAPGEDLKLEGEGNVRNTLKDMDVPPTSLEAGNSFKNSNKQVIIKPYANKALLDYLRPPLKK